MKYTISFIKNDIAYYATVFEFIDGSYDVIEFYYIENYKSINTDWKPFKNEIEALML